MQAIELGKDTNSGQEGPLHSAVFINIPKEAVDN